jgi:alkylhydroperoxidase family enzyme
MRGYLCATWSRSKKKFWSARQAAALFAQKLIEARGKVSDADFAAVRAAGYSDAQIVDIIALSAQFLLTNFMNNAAETDLDFPAVAPAKVIG